ncbi:MAG: hypothetical protein F6K45_21325 [Kamptonema sp. SIO1D9]|nr:hypothetical protein [Kamptonema sp. SIO1D9]
MNYTQLLLKHSLADIADGFDGNPKPFLKKMLSFDLGSNRLATKGETIWVYLMLKGRSLQGIYNLFSVQLYPKVPFFEFANFLNERIFKSREFRQVPMNKKAVRSFLQQNDTLILDDLGVKQMTEWLNHFDIELDIWLS